MQHRCELGLCLGARCQCQLCVDKGGVLSSSAEGVKSRMELERKLGRRMGWGGGSGDGAG